jgi:ABC-type multidrug transport system fused ATPase/permease subunit
VLNSVSFTIEKGKQTAFVGASGSGKSTVMQLLLRFYDPDSGRVLLNGEPLPVYDVHSLRDEIGVVGQEPKLFEARVWENVAWGARTELLDQLGDLSLVQDFASLLTMSDGHKKLHASVITACTTALAHKFIMRDLADEYDQLLLEGGRAVSGGQKQRLAIAGAIVRRPSILLLDVATSALDSESERRVQAALEKDLKESGLTMVLIAHRLSTLAHCDTVIVLDTGMIVERGSYAELASKEDGHFKTMLAEQGIVAAEGEGDGAAAAPALPIITRQASLSDAAEENLKGKIANVDEESKKKEDDQEEALTLLSGARTGFGVVCCTPLETRFYFIISTIVGVFAQPMIMMSMMIQLVVLAVIYSDANTNNTDTIKWWMFIEMLLSSLLIWFLAVSWYTPMFRAFGGLADSFRDRAYSALLRQDVSFFDKSENSVGVLTLLLAGDAESASVRYVFFCSII